MDDVLKAIVGLINTGGSLADDALYLYFTLRIIEPLSVTLTITGLTWIICKTILKVKGKG